MSDVTARFGEWIQRAFGGKVAVAAEALQWSRPGLYNYLKGKQEPGKVLLKRILDAGGNPTWIMSGVGDMFADNEAGRKLRAAVGTGVSEGPQYVALSYTDDPTIGMSETRVQDTMPRYRRKRWPPGHRIPLFLMPVAAGPPTMADDQIDRMVDLNEEYAPHASDTYLTIARGDSMTDAGIEDGDTIIVDRSIEAKHGRMVICSIDGTITVKRLSFEDGHPVLYPAHSNSPRIVINGDHKVEIWGVVTYVIKAMPM